MYLDLFLKIVKTIQAIIYTGKGVVKLHRLIKKNIDKILKVIYHNTTKHILDGYFLLSSAFFLFITLFGFFITFLKYDIFSSMFFFKTITILAFTLLSQGYLYYLHSDYSKSKLEYNA